MVFAPRLITDHMAFDQSARYCIAHFSLAGFTCLMFAFGINLCGFILAHNGFSYYVVTIKHTIILNVIVNMLVAVWKKPDSKGKVNEWELRMPEGFDMFVTKYNAVQKQLEAINGVDDLLAGIHV